MMSEQTKHGKRRNGMILTGLQAGMMKGILAGKSDMTAYRDAGGTGLNPKSAHDVKIALLEKVPAIMDRIGLTDEKLIRKYLKPALEATETKFVQKDGVFTDQRTVPAWEPRLKALDMAFQLHGSYAARPGTRVELPADGEIEVVVRRVE
jgi:hypothetical protein